MPDRNECVKCGVELPFYLGFGEDLCPRCLSRLALRGRRVELEEGENMEPDRKLCKFCGVELPFYLGPDDLCPRCKGEVRDGIITPPHCKEGIV